MNIKKITKVGELENIYEVSDIQMPRNVSLDEVLDTVEKTIRLMERVASPEKTSVELLREIKSMAELIIKQDKNSIKEQS